MLRHNAKWIDIITGEALLSLLREGAPVSNESLAARLQLFLCNEEDAHRKQAILDALRTLSTLSGYHHSSDKHADITNKQELIFHFSGMRH